MARQPRPQVGHAAGTDRQRLDFAVRALAAIAGKPADQRAWCAAQCGDPQPTWDRELRRHVAAVALERLSARPAPAPPGGTRHG